MRYSIPVLSFLALGLIIGCGGGGSSTTTTTGSTSGSTTGATVGTVTNVVIATDVTTGLITQITDIGGSGLVTQTTDALNSNILGLAVDSKKFLYFTDASKHTITRQTALNDASPAVLNLASTVNPGSIKIGTDNKIYQLDKGTRHTVVRYDGITGGNESALDLRNASRQADAFTLTSAGTLYVVCSNTSEILRFLNFTDLNPVVYTWPSSGTQQLKSLGDILVTGAVDSETITVSDTLNNRLVRFTTMAGTNWTQFGTGGTGVNQMQQPSGLSFDSAGRLYIADRGNHRLVRIDDFTGTNWTTYGTLGTNPGQFLAPTAVIAAP